MSKVLLAVSSFQKSDALKVLLDSLIEHGYQEGNKIIVTCDNAGKSYSITRKDNPNHPDFLSAPAEVMEIKKPSVPELLKDYPGIDCIYGDKRQGVAANKNRGIKYFLENPEYDYLLLLDDDIKFISPGFIDLCIESGMPHLTGYLGDPANDNIKFGETQSPFFTTFPPQGGNKYVWYCLGSQGMMLWFDRKTVEEVGYMDKMPDYYGMEHSLHSNRVNMLQGKNLDWFPILKKCHLYFQTQEVPNNYAADYSKNERYWHKRKEEVWKGITLRVSKWAN